MSRAALIPLVLLLAVAISGCTQSAPPATGPPGGEVITPGTGKLILQITDQPSIDVQRANVTISGVQVHALPASGNESEEVESGWITVNEGPVTFDLIALKDIKLVLCQKDLPSGRYTQIRLDVDQALVTIDSMLYNLTIPSGTVKFVRSFVINGDQNTALTLDFDAKQSIQTSGQFGRYVMNPVITVIQEDEPARDQACIDSGGTIMKEQCCKSADDLPNNCLIGACGCSYQGSKTTKVCECGKDKCFDGTSCVASS